MTCRPNPSTSKFLEDGLNKSNSSHTHRSPICTAQC